VLQGCWAFGEVTVLDQLILVEILIQGNDAQDSRRIYKNVQDEKGQLRVVETVQKIKGLETVTRIYTSPCNHFFCLQAHQRNSAVGFTSKLCAIRKQKVIEKMEELVLLEARRDQALRSYVQALDDCHRIDSQHELASAVSSALSSDMMLELSARKKEMSATLAAASADYRSAQAAWQEKDREMLELKKAQALAECHEQDASLKAVHAGKFLVGNTCPLLKPREFECENLCGFRGGLEEVHHHETSCAKIFPLLSVGAHVGAEAKEGESRQHVYDQLASPAYQASLAAARAAAAAALGTYDPTLKPSGP